MGIICKINWNLFSIFQFKTIRLLQSTALRGRHVLTYYVLGWNCIRHINGYDKHNSFVLGVTFQWTHFLRFVIDFDVEIPRRKFVEISLILKAESTWKLWHRVCVEVSTWIRISKSTKHRWVLHVDFSMLFRCQIDVSAVLAASILLFSNIFCSENLF